MSTECCVIFILSQEVFLSPTVNTELTSRVQDRYGESKSVKKETFKNY